MASRKIFFLIFVIYLNQVESATLLERSYEYVMNLGKSFAPSLMSIMDCLGENEFWGCAKEKAGKMLDGWDEDLEKQRRMWQVAADSEVTSSGRAIEEMPSQVARDVEESLTNLADVLQQGVARALSRKHHDEGSSIDLTISTSEKKKKMKKKKKTKPPKIHLVHPMMPVVQMERETRGFNPKAQTWVIGERLNASGVRKGRGMLSDAWSAGEKVIDAVAEHALKSDSVDDGIEDKSSVEEQRGKKKKKKKAILKLLILGAVLKAKIGTLLQILSFKLQVKFFLIALIGLGINLARFWIDVKKQHQPPQKVIYYEHAQHQHHYDHEEAEPGWGPWSRSMDPEETDVEIDLDVNSPYRAQIDRNTQAYSRPLLTRA